jgi:hypothetical protein
LHHHLNKNFFKALFCTGFQLLAVGGASRQSPVAVASSSLEFGTCLPAGRFADLEFP